MRKIAKAVLVTGGADRIGRQIALEFAAKGWAVAIHHNRSAKQASQTARLCQQAGAPKTATFKAELGKTPEKTKDKAKTTDQAHSLIERVIAQFGSLGCLINNASVYQPKTLAQTDRTDWHHHFGINAEAPFFLMKQFAASLPKGANGSVVNITDQRCLNLTPYYPAYSLSKVALEAATRLMAMRLAPRVRVNAVAPGHVLAATSQTAEEFTKLCLKTPLKRAVQPTDVAKAVMFVATCQSITGTTIAVDCGQHLGWRQPFDNDKMPDN